MEFDSLSREKLIRMGAKFPKAGDRALTKIARQAKTVASSEIRSDINLKKSDVDPTFQVIPSQGGKLVAIVRALRSRRFNLIRFGARQGKKGVTFAFKKRQRQTIAGAFIANRGRTVFKRVGKARLPIKSLLSPYSVTQLFGSDRMKKRIQEFVHEAYPRVLIQELKYFFSQR